MIKVVCIHNDPLLRQPIDEISKNAPDIQIVGEVSTGQAGLQHIQKYQPQVVILGWPLSDISGPLVDRLLKCQPTLQILSVFPAIRKKISSDILVNGVCGYITAQVTPEEWVNAIHSVSAGKRIISEEILKNAQSSVSYLKMKAWLKPSAQRFSKTTEEIHTLEDVLSDLQYSLADFPLAALEAAARYQQPITPILLSYIEDILNPPRQPRQPDYCAHLYALYLLAQFREKALFPKLIAILKTRKRVGIIDDYDLLAYDLPNIMASTFNGDLKSLYALIEDPQISLWVRETGIWTLSALYTVGEISYSTIVGYYRYLFTTGLKKSNRDLLTEVASCIIDIYAHELFDVVKTAFAAGRIDTRVISLEDLEEQIIQGEQAAREYRTFHYYIIQDAGIEMFEESRHPVAQNIRENIFIELLNKNGHRFQKLDFNKIKYVDLYQPGRYYAGLSEAD